MFQKARIQTVIASVSEAIQGATTKKEDGLLRRLRASQ
jgi:hypothetical protein